MRMQLTPEQEQAIADHVRKLNAFSSGASKTCPLCDTPIEGIRLYEKIEPDMFSLYVLPCDHRLGLWGGAPEWCRIDGLPIEIIESEW